MIVGVPLTTTSLAKIVDKKAKQQIITNIGRAVEGKYSTIQTVTVATKSAPNVTITVYNKTSGGGVLPGPIIPPPPVNGTTSPAGYKICFVGDFKNTKPWDAMKNCNFKVALGDNGYSDNLNLLKEIKPDRCVPGNHDTKEDGSTTLEKETLAYCGNSWWAKFGSTTLLLGFNTNGDSAKQLNAAKSLFNNSQIMNGVKNVIAVSHKGGHTFPNSHHPAEAKSFYTSLESVIPQGKDIKLYEIAAHNHNSAAAPAKGWYIAGSGGKSFYSCGQDKDWNFCNNKAIAYLEATILDNNDIALHFVDTTGKLIL